MPMAASRRSRSGSGWRSWRRSQRSRLTRAAPLPGSRATMGLSRLGRRPAEGAAAILRSHSTRKELRWPPRQIRELAQTGGTGFGFATSPGKVEAETLEALRSSMALLAAKAPAEQEPYRTLVLEVAQRVADAKGGVTDKETGAIAKVKEALGDAQA